MFHNLLSIGPKDLYWDFIMIKVSSSNFDHYLMFHTLLSVGPKDLYCDVIIVEVSWSYFCSFVHDSIHARLGPGRNQKYPLINFLDLLNSPKQIDKALCSNRMPTHLILFSNVIKTVRNGEGQRT